MISQVDLLATLAAIAGASVPKGAASDSQELSSTLTGESAEEREFVVEHSGLAEALAIRHGNCKYIQPSPGPALLAGKDSETANNRQAQLYNLAADEGETNNVAKAHPAKVAELQSLLKAVRTANPQLAEPQGSVSGE